MDQRGSQKIPRHHFLIISKREKVLNGDMLCRNVNTGNTCRRYINMNMRRCFPLLTVWSAVCLTVILPEVITPSD